MGQVDRPMRAIVLTVAGIAALAIALTALATLGHDLLPAIMQGNDYTLMVSKGVSPAIWLLTLIAMAVLWQPPQRVVDLWLMLVMWIWLFDIALSAVIGSSRFDLGFYAGRLFGLVASAFLLITLLVEMGRLYARALASAADAQRLPVREPVRSGINQNKVPAAATSDTFVTRQNIARYREMLDRQRLDDVQRRSIESLLASEELKLVQMTKPTSGSDVTH